MPVTWVELPADAPEPPPYSIVRDQDADTWVRMADEDGATGGWRMVGARDTGRWAGLLAYAPLHILQVDASTPVPGLLISEPVEPSAYEYRERALMAAAQYAGRRPGDWTPEAVVEAARVFEPYLRGDA